MPDRIQRRRTKGWRMPPNAVSVTRPGRWGNPFSVWAYGREEAVWLHREWLLSDPERVAQVRRELRGRTLACWCAEGQPCHGDTLAEVAAS